MMASTAVRSSSRQRRRLLMRRFHNSLHGGILTEYRALGDRRKCDPILDQIATCRPIDDVAPSRKLMCFVNRMRVKVWVRIFGENHPLVSGHDGTIGSG